MLCLGSHADYPRYENQEPTYYWIQELPNGGLKVDLFVEAKTIMVFGTRNETTVFSVGGITPTVSAAHVKGAIKENPLLKDRKAFTFCFDPDSVDEAYLVWGFTGRNGGVSIWTELHWLVDQAKKNKRYEPLQNKKANKSQQDKPR
jgi:hypothetical protein